MKLQTRILLLPFIALLPALGLLILNQWDLDRSRHQELEQQVLNQARQISAEVDRISEGALQFLVALAQVPEIKNGDTNCGALLANIRTNYNNYLAIIRADVEGNITCSSIGPGPSIKDRLYFRRATEGKTFSVGEYIQGRGTRADTIHFAYPLQVGDNVVGVIAAALDLDWFAQRLTEKMPVNSALNVADGNGTILVRLPNNQKFRGQQIPSQFQPIIFSPIPGVTQVKGLDGLSQLLGFVPIPASSVGFHVGVAKDLEPAFSDIHRARTRGFISIAIGLVLSLVLATLWVHFGIRRPVSALIATVRRWEAGDYEPVPLTRDSSEIGKIATAFQQLMSTVRERESQLKDSEQRLAANQRYLRTVLDEVPIGIMQTLPDKTYGFVNKGFCALLGLNEQDLLGHSFTEVTHPDDIKKDADLFVRSLNSRAPYTHRKRYLRPDGKVVWAENTVTHLDNGQGVLAVSISLEERMKAERMQQRLTDELNHRVKNTLATVQAIALISKRYAKTADQYVDDLLARIRALALTHNLLTREKWEKAKLADLIAAELEPYLKGRVIDLKGREVTLSPKETVSFGLIVHELATNAAKYGALSTSSGKLKISWNSELVHDAERLTLNWEESGVLISEPTGSGFGSKLVEQCLADINGKAKQEFKRTGLHYVIVSDRVAPSLQLPDVRNVDDEVACADHATERADH
jgi:PAS domain S-box-containing protein